MMLPGVEVARRRRVRAGQGRDGAYEGGVSRSETHRSRLGVNGTHHLSRLGSSRPQALLRLQENLHEQHSDSSSSSAAAGAATIRISSSNSPSDTENLKADNHHDHHHRPREESRGTKCSCLWRRRSSCSHSDPSGLVVEARYRLDELLQAADNHAARTSSSSSMRNLATRQQHTAQSAEHSTGLDIYFNSRRTSSSSGYSWLAGLATCVQSVKQCLSKVEVNSRTSTTSTKLSSSAPGQRRAMIRALLMPNWRVEDGPGQDDCPVCLEALVAGEATITLLCNHTFHPQCLTPWLSRDDKCPCCRARITRHVQKHISHELRSRTLPAGGDGDLICSRVSKKLSLKDVGAEVPNCLTVNVEPSLHPH